MREKGKIHVRRETDHFITIRERVVIIPHLRPDNGEECPETIGEERKRKEDGRINIVCLRCGNQTTIEDARSRSK